MKSVLWLVFTGRPGCPQTEACPSPGPISQWWEAGPEWFSGGKEEHIRAGMR